jgi:hypothetical protein
MCAAMAAVTPLLGADCDNGAGGPTPTPTPVCSPTTITPVNVAPGVDYYDCSASTKNVHVVTINRNRGDSEMWILDDPTVQPGTLNLRTVEEHVGRANAIVAVNGYIWSGDNGVIGGGVGTPLTTSYASGRQISANTAHCDGIDDPCPEALMGFAAGTATIDVRRIPAGTPAMPDDGLYYENIYGSNTSVIASGACVNEGNDNWSVVGYSPKQIVLLTTGTSLRHADMCPVLLSFGVTEAVRQDGSSAATMYIDRNVGKRIDPAGFNRHVAYAIGLVDLYPRTVMNQSFEMPVLDAGQAYRRMTYENEATTLTGWQGPVDLHSGTDLVAHGAQIVDLNQTDSGYVETSFTTPAETECLVRFYHGVNHHCTQTATFDVKIDGVTARSFTSTYDPAALRRDSVRFHTSGTSTTLRFESTTHGCGAATIDDVSVSCTRM